MTKGNRKGLNYFPFEINFFQDIKVRKLIKYQGCKAMPVYALLLCKIYENGYYMRWDEELPFIISETTGYEEGYVREAIKCCIKVELFSGPMFEEKRVLTSKGIQDRFVMISKQLKRKFDVSEYSLIISEESEKIPEKPTILPKNSGENGKTSEEQGGKFGLKEKKGKEIELTKDVEDILITKGREKVDSTTSEIELPDFVIENRQQFREEIKQNPPQLHEPPPNLDESAELMKASSTLMEAACIGNKISQSDYFEAIDTFVRDKKAVNYVVRSESDVKKHFLYWLPSWQRKQAELSQSGPAKGKIEKSLEVSQSAADRIKAARSSQNY